MKTISTFLLAFLLCNITLLNAQTSTAAAGPVSYDELVAWSTMTYEFGTIDQNVPATAEFVLTNKGNQPIVITDVKKTCGCTVPSYEKDPIFPKGTSTIKATYNAKKAGPFTKTIKVYTTLSDQPILLKLKGVVATKDVIAEKVDKL